MQLGTGEQGLLMMASVREDDSYRIVVVGDFGSLSGEDSAGDGIALDMRTAWRPVQIDRDNFEAVMKAVGPACDLPSGVLDGGAASVVFGCLEDFEPDQLFQSCEIFERLRSLRERLLDSASFDAAAAEVLSWGNMASIAGEQLGDAAKMPTKDLDEKSPQDIASDGSKDSGPSDGSLLDQMLDAQASDDSSSSQNTSEAASSAERTELHQMIQSIVAPYVQPDSMPRQKELLQCVDEAISVAMRSVLHGERFRALESAWRGLWWMVRKLETGPQLKVFFLNRSRAELEADLANDAIESTALHRCLVQEAVDTPGGEPWSLIVHDAAFGPTDHDAELLGKLGALASKAHAPLIAAASSECVGGRQIEESDFTAANITTQPSWQRLRQSAVAASIALTWPRFLLRLPYGATTNPIEEFEFEEQVGSVEPARLLWGNSALLAATLLGQMFAERGFVNATVAGRVGGMPVWSYEQDGETHLHPCGEFLLTDTAISELRSIGLTPLASVRDRDEVRMAELVDLAGQKLDLERS